MFLSELGMNGKIQGKYKLFSQERENGIFFLYIKGGLEICIQEISDLKKECIFFYAGRV